MAKRPGFTYAPQRLREFAQSVLDAAKRGGASGCECDVSEGYGLSVTVRKGEPETIEHNRDKSIGVSVYAGERPKARRGHASTSDFSTAAIAQTGEAGARRGGGRGGGGGGAGPFPPRARRSRGGGWWPRGAGGRRRSRCRAT